MRLPLSCALAALVTFAALATPACTNSGTGGSGAGSYCSLLSGYVSKCQITDPCTLATVKDCATLGAAFSAAYLNAITQCDSSLPCPDARGTTAATQCIESAVTSAPQSAAQQKLAEDYCSTCPTSRSNVDGCVAGFYATAYDASSDAPPIGQALITYSDAISTKMDSACTSSVSDAGILGRRFAFEALRRRPHSREASCRASPASRRRRGVARRRVRRLREQGRRRGRTRRRGRCPARPTARGYSLGCIRGRTAMRWRGRPASRRHQAPRDIALVRRHQAGRAGLRGRRAGGCVGNAKIDRVDAQRLRLALGQREAETIAVPASTRARSCPATKGRVIA